MAFLEKWSFSKTPFLRHTLAFFASAAGFLFGLDYLYVCRMKSRILLTVTNDLTYDRRMQRICTTLAAAGYAVSLVGRRLPDSLPLRELAFRQRRLTCYFRKGKLFYLEYNLRLFFFLLFARADCFSAVDLDTLLPCYLAGRLRRKAVVYDAHEYFTEVPEVVRRPLVRKIWAAVGRLVIPRLQHCYTVGPQLARVLTARYGPDFRVVRNVPFRSSAAQSPRQLSERPILLYQGALNEGRGLETLIDALGHFPQAELWLVGEGDLSPALRDRAAGKTWQDRIRFWGYRRPEELPAITTQASLGFNLLEDQGLSYYYSLANKTFDYIQEGLPGVHMAFPEYRALDERYDCCYLLDELSVNRLVNLLQDIFDDPATYAHKSANGLRAAGELCWEKEQDALLQLYHRALP